MANKLLMITIPLFILGAALWLMYWPTMESTTLDWIIGLSGGAVAIFAFMISLLFGGDK